MGLKQRIIKEVRSIFWTSLYFLVWFGSLMLIKVLLLEEYEIRFYGISALIVGALVVAKAVLILGNLPVTKAKKQPAWLVVLKRTSVFLAGVFVILLLEKSIEGRHEYGGIANAFKHLFRDANMYHVWVNTLVVFGALLSYNLGILFKKYIGKAEIKKMLLSPYPDNP